MEPRADRRFASAAEMQRALVPFAGVLSGAVLARELQSASYQPRQIVVGSATDAYQPAERRLGITRQVIEVCSEFRHPFSLITKSSGVERDIDLIAPMAAQRLAGLA